MKEQILNERQSAPTAAQWLEKQTHRFRRLGVSSCSASSFVEGGVA